MLTMIVPNTNNLINFIIDEECCYITTNKTETDHSLGYMLKEADHAISAIRNITPQKDNFFNKLILPNIFDHQKSASYSNNLHDLLYHLKKDLLDNGKVEFDQHKDRIIFPNSLFYQVEDISDKDSEELIRCDLLGVNNLELIMKITDSGLLNFKSYEIKALVHEIGNNSGNYYGAFFYCGRSTYSLIPKNIYDILALIKEHKSQLLDIQELSPEFINNKYVAKIKKIIANNPAIHIDQLSQFNLDFICFDDDEKNVIELQKYLSDHGNIRIEPKFINHDIEFNRKLLKKIRDFNGKSPYYKLNMNGKETIVTFNHKLCDLLEKICDNQTISKEYLAQLMSNPNELELFKNTGELIHVSEFAENIIGFTIQDDMNFDRLQLECKNNWSYPVELEFTDLNDNLVKQEISSADEMRVLQKTITKHNAQKDPYFTINTEQGIVACPFSEPNLNTLEREGILLITIDNNDENSSSKDLAVIELHNIYNDTIQLLKSYQKRVVKDIYEKILSNSILDISNTPYNINIEYLNIKTDIIKTNYNAIYLDAHNLLKIAKGLRFGFQFSNEEQFDLTEFKQEQLEKLNLETLFAQPHLPGTLKATLKNHQKYGISWLQRCYYLKEQDYQYQGVLLADDMGLGKTIQVLTFIEYLITVKKISKPILIVSPIQLFNNWKEEYVKHFRYEQSEIDKTVLVLHDKELKNIKHYTSGGESKLNNIYSSDTAIANLDTNKIQSYRVIITNYDTVSNNKYSLCSRNWGLVVLDEAQNIKSRDTRKTRDIKTLKADFRIAITGTPVENSLLDLFSILEFLKIKVVDGEAKEFKKQFCDQSNQEESLQELKKRLFYNPNQPLPYAYLLRRLKDGNIELPVKKICEPYEVQYLDSQYQDYKMLREQMRSKRINPLTALEKINLLHQAYPCYKNPNECESNLLKMFALDNKAKQLIAILEDIIYRSDDKILIFVRYKKVQRLIQLLIHNRFNMEPSIINGENKNNNNTKIDQWRADHNNRVLILSPKVAGVGLNLTEANHVVHYGRWWNPAVESQATDRVYRIGQRKPVYVYYINYIDKSNNPIPSFDEKLTELLQSKINYATDFLHPYDNEEQLSEELIQQILQ